MKCPYCGFDNSFYGTDDLIVCAACGTAYDTCEYTLPSNMDKYKTGNSFVEPDIHDITFLFPKIKKIIESGEISFYAKKEYCYGDNEFNLLKKFLPDNYELEIVKRLRQRSDVFIEIFRDRRKPTKEKEMYHIYKKDMYKTDSEVEYLLQKSGKEVFLNILFPELMKDINVTIEELTKKYSIFESFSINSQRTRLSKAKKIFKMNKQKEAMHIIMLSKRISENNKYIARQYYKQL